ncbi:MAG: APC family permease [Pseudomonadota bacterium]
MSWIKKIEQVVIGGDRDLNDPAIFHKLSLMAFFAWIGLGTDGLSSSCYGPEEAFRVLTYYPCLALIVAIATTVTIFIISAGYNQIIEVFPTGGGGYMVASKLLNPTVGMISGCALLVDYVLTISLSVSSGVDAMFSFMPSAWLEYKLITALTCVVLLIVINMRGTKESVMPLVPIFLVFIFTHAFAFIYTLIVHAMDFPQVISETSTGFKTAYSELGMLGLLILIMKAYSMGAGTFTGIEAVSNGLPILRAPKVATAKKTMTYMSVSLSVTVIGFMLGYILYHVVPTPDMSKTLNALYFEKMTVGWSGKTGHAFVWITLFSEAALLFIAAQTGFLDGPRVIANMALDRWFPTKFAMLSNRLVNHNGILLMGITALLTILLAHGNVRILVVLYSINVFITFVLSQLGMIRHWWNVRSSDKHWIRCLIINGIGFVLTVFILSSVVVLKFHEGGWVTIFVTGSLIAAVLLIKKHYSRAGELLQKLNTLVSVVSEEMNTFKSKKSPEFDPHSKTAVILVSGFNGIGLHTLMNVIKVFDNIFKNYVFVQIGVVDAGTFKGSEEISQLHVHTNNDTFRYVEYMKQHGYYAESFTAIGNDVIKEVIELTPKIREKFSNIIFFGGQLVLPEENFITKWLHNYITFELQRRFYQEGTPFMIMPIRV